MAFPSFASLLRTRARELGDAVFFRYYPDGTSTEVRSVRWSGLARDAEAVAIHLRDRFEVRAGDRIAVVSRNSADLVVVFCALGLLGATIVPVHPEENPARLRELCEFTGASLVLAAEASLWDSTGLAVLGLSELLDRARGGSGESLAEPQLPVDHPFLIVFTSGTTGHSKGVQISFANLCANARSLAPWHGLDRGVKHLCVLPLYHVNAFGLSFFTSLWAGAAWVLCERFRPETFCEVAAREKVDFASTVPVLLKRLLSLSADEGLSRTRFPSLRYVLTAAAPLEMDLACAFVDRTGIPVLQGYGLSEATNFSATMPREALTDSALYSWLMFSESRPSIGCELPGNGIEIAPSVDGSHVGEILVSGENLSSGYFGNEAATNATFVGGKLRTGDLGYAKNGPDGRTYYFVSGRLKEIIKRNGETFYVSDIEAELRACLEGREYAVVGFPNEHTQEEIGLWVTGDPDPETLARVQKALPWSRVPKAIVWGGEIPRTPSFKVKRALMSESFSPYAKTLFRRSAS